ncbi:MAG: type I restriction endonuclease subunit R, partial [Anaerolineae bacterium]|nr:type I restriction endonuclease subunit R [Anaerolineae bacterium]
MSRLSEKQDVQNELIHHLRGIGWRYLPPGDVDVLRDGNRAEPFLPGVLHDKLIALNPGLVTDQNVDDVLNRLRRIPANLEGNEQLLTALRGGWTVYHPEEKRERNLAVIGFDDLQTNDFCFTQELPFEDRGSRRPDMVLYVNGLPLVIIENKSPTLSEPELEAFDQVQHLYTAEIPGLLRYTLFFAGCDLRIHYGATWNDDVKAFYRWKSEGKDYGLERLGKTLFARQQILHIARDYTIFFRADDQTHKFILRPHQMRTTELIVQRVAAALPSPGGELQP